MSLSRVRNTDRPRAFTSSARSRRAICECDVLLQASARPARPGILAAVAGVDHDRAHLRLGRLAGTSRSSRRSRSSPLAQRRAAAHAARAPVAPGPPARSPSASGSGDPARPRTRSRARRGTGPSSTMPPASRAGCSVTSSRSRGTATVTRPASCCTRNGRLSLASNTTRTSSAEANALTVTFGITIGPITSTRCGRTPLHGPLEQRAQARAPDPRPARASAPPRTAPATGSSFRSPSTDARLFLWWSTSSCEPR